VVKCTVWTLPRGVSVTALEGGHTHRRHLQDVAEGRIRNSDASVHRFVIFFSCLYTTQIIVSNFFFHFIICPYWNQYSKSSLRRQKFCRGVYLPCTPNLCIRTYRHKNFANNIYEKTWISFRSLIQNCCSLVSRLLGKFLTSTLVYYDRHLQMFWRIMLPPSSLEGDGSNTPQNCQIFCYNVRTHGL